MNGASSIDGGLGRTLALAPPDCAAFCYGHAHVAPSQLSLPTIGGNASQAGPTTGANLSVAGGGPSVIDGSMEESASAPVLESEKARCQYKGKQMAIPRPPNAWILYRSAKIKEKTREEWMVEHGWQRFLTTPLTSSPAESSSSVLEPAWAGPTKPCTSLQSFLSRRLADMWKAEQSQVKDYYHALAEEKKREHAQRYPGYRFKPRQFTKEEKHEQIREKVARSRAQTACAQPYNDVPTQVRQRREASTANAKSRPPLDLSINVPDWQDTVSASSYSSMSDQYAGSATNPPSGQEEAMFNLLMEELTPTTPDLTASPLAITPTASAKEGTTSEDKRRGRKGVESLAKAMKRSTARRKSTSSAGRRALLDLSPSKQAAKSVQETHASCQEGSPAVNSPLKTLQRSFDVVGNGSEEDDAALLESFAVMPAWSPNQSWLPTAGAGQAYESSPTISTDVEQASSNWTFYSHSAITVLSALTDVSSLPSSAPVQTNEEQLAVEYLLQQLDQISDLPQLPLAVSPTENTACSDEEAFQAAASMLTEWHEPAINLQDVTPAPAMQATTLTHDEWDRFLAEAVFEQPHAEQGRQRQPETVCLDPPSLPALTPVYSTPQTANPAASPLQAEASFVELHGAFTEQELLEKLDVMRRARAEQTVQGQEHAMGE